MGRVPPALHGTPMLTIIAIIAGIVVGGTIGLFLLIALLGALQDRARGVTPLVARLTREGVPVGTRSAIHAELSEIGGKLVPFALIGLVFGVPVLALGWNEVSSFGLAVDELPYLAPGVALLGVGVLLLVAGRAKLRQS